MNNVKWTKTCLISAALAAAATTHAQGIEEIVVTAQRRAENLQEVPVAITALSAQVLANSGISTTADLSAVTPGLVMTSSLARAQPYLRGIGTQGTQPGEEGSIATYVDGVYYASLAANFFALSGVERVEVLKGPQGTLFGRNATGGLIHIITREPQQETFVEGSVSMGNYDTVEGSFYATTGLTDTLAADISVFTIDQGEGWGKNLVTGKEVNMRDEWVVRSKLRWDATDRTVATFSADFQKNDNDLGAVRNIHPDTIGFGGTPFRGSIYDSQANIDPYIEQENWGASLIVSHDLGYAELKSTTAYRSADGLTFWDMDTTPIPLIHGALNEETRTFQQEFILTGSAERLDWTTGVFYYEATAEMDDLELFSDLVPAQRIKRFSEINTESFAVFAQGDYALTERASVTAGLRYTRDERDVQGYDMASTGNPAPYGTVFRTAKDDDTYEKLTYRLALDYQLSDATLLYASYSRGFKSGMYAGTSPFDPGVEPETLDALEVGIKATVLDNRLRFNGAIFAYDYQDIQLSSTETGVSRLLNAAEGEVYGADLDVVAIPFAGVPDFEITLGLSVLDTEYSDFKDAPFYEPAPAGGNVLDTIDASGHDMIRSPDFTTNLGFNYSVAVSDSLRLIANANWYHSDGFYWEPDNRLKQDAYDLVNAQIGFSTADDAWRVRLFARNLLDEEYFTLATITGQGDAMGPGAPRTYGVAFDFQIGH
ncbi:MAG: TonB-dependent receptor [Porticoccaceae bacterium]